MTRPLTNDDEILDAPPGDAPPSDMQEGTVGHEGSKEICTLGTSAEAGDGMTFVRVTLRLGHPALAPKSSDGLFNGHKVEARVMGPGWRVPKRGARVLVCFPGGDFETPGNGVILGEIGSTPNTRFGRKKTVLDFGSDDVVITAKSLALVVEAQEDGAAKSSRYSLSLDPRGGLQAVADGSGLFIKDGQVALKAVDADGNLMTSAVLDQDELGLFEGSTLNQSTFSMSGGDITMIGQFMNIVPKTTLMIGQSASPATPMLVGPTGVAGIPSLFIFAAVNP
jgi:hypothetical protein